MKESRADGPAALFGRLFKRSLNTAEPKATVAPNTLVRCFNTQDMPHIPHEGRRGHRANPTPNHRPSCVTIPDRRTLRLWLYIYEKIENKTKTLMKQLLSIGEN